MSEPDDHPLKITPLGRLKPPAPPRRRRIGPRASGAGCPLTVLPPIFSPTPPPGESPRSPSPASPLPTDKLWSRYHQGCVAKSSAFLDWTARKVLKKKAPKNVKRPYLAIGSLPKCNLTQEDEDAVSSFLEQHRELVEAHVMAHVPVCELERWLWRKVHIDSAPPAQREEAVVAAGSKQTAFTVSSRQHEDAAAGSKQTAFTDLLSRLQENASEGQLLWELASCVGAAVGADVSRVYQTRPGQAGVVHCLVADHDATNRIGHKSAFVQAEADTALLVAEVARGGVPFSLPRADRQAPGAPGTATNEPMKDLKYVLYQPILTSDTSYVIELWRDKSFQPSDEQACARLSLWGALAVHYCGLSSKHNKERNMADFLLDVVKAIFEEMVSLDQLIKRILEFAQRLVNADRASLFLVDYRNFQLVSTVFDLKFERGQERDLEKKEIRMPINRGIAGHVALSGETMNIPDAYSDYRFNRDVDEATGYKTISILCMPIKVEGKVIGVVQMVNKRSESKFGHEDEVAFEIFSTFFGLALHHARLYDRIMRKEQKYRVALEVLSYHNTCRENEVQALLAEKSSVSGNLNDFYLDPYSFNEYEKCQCALKMFNELFDMSAFDVVTVTRFILTVKKNYRTVPYHNFDHGWAVAHAMYVILSSDAHKRFDYKIRLALFVACLCHDLDHRGYTNKYMSETASPLAAMYTTSTLEHHHFNITVTILQQDGHNIFSHMSSEDYKEVLGYIRQAILATDLAAFFPNLDKMKDLHREDNVLFDWENTGHRDLALAISMTAADLSASAKPWDIQIKTVKVIFEEFYDQGDKEAAAGRTPIPMMDRTKTEEQPASQVGFLSQICIPCYTVLCNVLPNTKPMYVMAMKNLRRWKARADKVAQKTIRGEAGEHSDETEESEIEEDIVEEIAIEEKSTASAETTVEVMFENLATKDDSSIEPVDALREIDPPWEDDVDENRVCKEFWKKTDEAWVDDEGVVVPIKSKDK